MVYLSYELNNINSSTRVEHASHTLWTRHVRSLIGRHTLYTLLYAPRSFDGRCEHVLKHYSYARHAVQGRWRFATMNTSVCRRVSNDRVAHANARETYALRSVCLAYKSYAGHSSPILSMLKISGELSVRQRMAAYA